MPRAYTTYVVPQGDASAHDNAVSTGTGDLKTLAAPRWANACFLCVETSNARVTFSGEDPGAGVAPGLIIVAGGQPVFFPFAHDIEFVSEGPGSSEMNVLWLA